MTNILLIEDNPGDARLIQAMLTTGHRSDPLRPGFRLFQADRLAAGLAQVDQTNPDLLLLDLMLPDSDGLETFYRAQAHAPDLPIIILTGLNDSGMALAAVQAGAQDYYIKGEFDDRSLTRAILYAIERAQAAAARRESEKFLQATLDALSAHLAILDESGAILAVNAAWRNFGAANGLRLANDGVGANYLAICDRAVGDWSEGAAEAAAGIRQVAARQLEEFQLEYPCLDLTGPRWFIMRATRFNSNDSLRVVVSHDDITRRKQAEVAMQAHSERLEELVEARTEALRQAQAELVHQEKLAMLGQLAAGVSHELRNPLGAIKNAAYYLNLTLSSPSPEVQEVLTILEKEVQTSEQIISSLLDFGRARPPRRRPVELNELVREVLVETTRPGSQDIEILFQPAGRLPDILVDPDQMRLVLGNLIQNAIQAMSPSNHIWENRRLTIKTELPSPEWVIISVADTGQGIAAENLERIFEPLFTTKAKGIGLGLALVRTLVEAHGGNITVDSQPDQGSTFTITLPTGMGETPGVELEIKKK